MQTLQVSSTSAGASASWPPLGSIALLVFAAASGCCFQGAGTPQSTSDGSAGSGTTSSAGTGTSSSGLATGSSTGATTGGSGGTILGEPCTVNHSLLPDQGGDSCTPEGYECSAEFSQTTSVCVLPQELFLCDESGPDTGCQDGGQPGFGDAGAQLQCIGGFTEGTTTVSACAYPCAFTGECGPVYEYCAIGFGFCFINNCSGTLSPCESNDGSSHGQCLAFRNQRTRVEGLFCYEDGTASQGTPCNPIRRSGAASECAFGEFCLPNRAGDGGLCYPISPDGGCAEGEAAIGGLINPPLGPTYPSDWSICALDCSTGEACVMDAGAEAGLMAIGTCQPLPNGTGSACLP